MSLGSAHLLAIRACHGPVLLGSAAVAGLTVALSSDSRVPIPAREGIASVIWPLIPAIVAIVAPPVLATSYGLPESLAGRSAVALRRFHLGIVAAGFAVMCLMAPTAYWPVLIRNSGLLLGAVLIATVLLGPKTAWIPAFMFPVFCWLLGTERRGQTQPWAVLLRPETSRASQIVAGAALALGVALYFSESRQLPVSLRRRRRAETAE